MTASTSKSSPRPVRKPCPGVVHYRVTGEKLSDCKFTEQEVKQQGYPHYYSETWLRRQKGKLGTFAEISRRYGYSESTLYLAARRFKWPLEKPSRWQARLWVQAEWLTGSTTKSALQKKYRVSINSVFLWVKELESSAECRQHAMEWLAYITEPGRNVPLPYMKPLRSESSL